MITTSLRFKNPPVDHGHYVTIRRGYLHPLARFLILNAAGEYIASAALETCFTTQFNAIRPEVLNSEHDPACRTIAGLFAKLRTYYPGFTPDEKVTVIRFSVL